MVVKKLNHCQAQWSLYLARFDFLLYYRPRRSIGKLDLLFRQSDHSTKAIDNQNIVLLHIEFSAVHAIKIFALEGEECSILRDIYHGNQNGR